MALADEPMRILLLILQFPPDVNSTGSLMARIGEGLVARGHRVSVITTLPHYQQFHIWDEYRGKLAQRELYHGMDVQRLWVFASTQKKRMLHRLLSYLSFNALATIASLWRRAQYDVVLCTNGSFFTGIAASIHGALRGAPFIYNVQDLYPEAPVAAGQLTVGTATRALGAIERFMYRRAAHISVITPSFRENIVAKGIAASKISVIPNFVDTTFIRPLPRNNALAARLGLDNKFVVTHAGNIGYVYDLDSLLHAAALLRDMDEFCFLIVGDGVAKPALEAKAQAMELSNVRFLPFQPLEDLPWLRAASDVQVALYRRHAGSYSMPSKVYEIMASGRPLLASADRESDVWRLVVGTRCGICVEPEDPAALAAALRMLWRDTAERRVMGTNGRHHAEQRFTADAAVDAYEALLRAVSNGSARDTSHREVVDAAQFGSGDS